ncbi:MAG: single-stranded-DNA-specific exonuclease RecJ, partial [Alphaproteobacteria bacterium]
MPDTLTEDALFGVARSISGRTWRMRPVPARIAEAISQALGVPEIVGRVLAGRGVDVDSAADYLNPSLRTFMPDPYALADMAVAAERVADAIMAGEQTAVFGDYDVDGATSSALLKHFFEAAGGHLQIYIPDRITEGYGPNAPALLGLKEAGVSLVLTVDCGVSAYEPLAEARAAGLDVIVVDHHQAEPRLPEAVAAVNPNRLDDDSGLGYLAAVGVTYLLVVAVNRLLRDRGWYGTTRPEPNLLDWLDLVALGTVCDVVPLTGLNRALTAQGLKVMARRRNPGLAALADVARLDERPGTYHLGFVMGPRVNAGG